MAANIDLLREGLKDYISSLYAHNKNLHEDYRDLSIHFAALQQVYEGQGAEEFKSSWLNTARWFEQYIDQTFILVRFLEERVTWLEQEK